MAYNSGRGGGNFRPSAASVGQRRPAPFPRSNFVPGGQLQTPGQQYTPRNSSPQALRTRMQQLQLHSRQQIRPAIRQRQSLPQQQQMQVHQTPVLKQEPVQPVQSEQPVPQQQKPPLLQQPPSQQQQQKPPLQQQQQQNPLPQQQQQQPPLQQQSLLQQQQPPVPVQQQLPVAQKKVAVPLPITEPKVEVVDVIGDLEAQDVEMNDPQQKRKPWYRRKGVSKVHRKEKTRLRNMRLRKLLQPKTALMVLNEMCGSTCSFAVTESTDQFGSFVCTVNLQGHDYVGLAKSKPAAKTAAAEEALRHVVLSKLREQAEVQQQQKQQEQSSAPETPQTQGDESMDTSTTSDDGVCWSNIASFALHKLLSSWDLSQAGPFDMDMKPMLVDYNQDKRPAKKLPDSASLMNPIMLLNQMRPGVIFEERGQVGTPPNTQFMIDCKIDEQSFEGIGSTKKLARRRAAFKACETILGIRYSPEFLQANGVDAVAT